MHRTLPTFLLLLAGACSESAQAPTQVPTHAPATPAGKAFTAGDVSVEFLPFSGKGHAQAMVVNDSGRVFGHQWTTPSLRILAAFTWPATSGGPSTLPASGDHANRRGDLVVSGGVLLRSSSGTTWNFATLPGGAPGTINDAREFAGWVSERKSPVGRPVFWTSPSSQPLNLPIPPGTTEGFVSAMNDAGDVLGHVTVPISSTASERRVFVWKRTAPASWALQAFPIVDARSADMNDAGQVVVTKKITDDAYATLILTPNGGSYDVVQVVAYESSSPAVDQCGRVSGGTHVNGVTHGYVWESGTLTILPLPPGTTQAMAWDIAAVDGGPDVVVGRARNSDGNFRPVRWTIPECGA